MNANFRVRALLCLYTSLLLGSFSVHSQALTLGDSLPPALWQTPLPAINHHRETLTLGEFNEPLILLDFWATWCSPCIAMLPRQDSLQKQFADRLRILPVTYQSREEVSGFLKKYAQRKGLHLETPEVVDDEVLNSVFPHATLPHYVWVKNGIVKAITGHEDVNARQIAGMLNEEALTMKTKSQVPPLGYSPAKVTLTEFLAHNRPDLLAGFGFRSVLSGYIPGLASQVSVTRPADGFPAYRFTFTNVPLLRLFQFAYGEGTSFTNLSSILLETPDSARVMQPHSVTDFMEWNLKHAWCYELVLPDAFSGDGFEMLRKQLALLFPQYEVAIENRSLPVLALQREPEHPLAVAPDTTFSESYDGFTYAFSGTASRFVKTLNGIYLAGISETVVDLTGSSQTIALRLEANLSKVSELDKALRPHGLRLSKTTASIPALIIKDAP
jgi:thiol-disulfide isomerase/thioredoxin